MLRVFTGYVSSPESVSHVHYRRDAPLAGALHQLRDAAIVAETVSRYVTVAPQSEISCRVGPLEYL